VIISTQSIIATCAAVVATAAAAQAVVGEWKSHQFRSINAVTFLWLGVAYFVGVGAIAAAFFYTRAANGFGLRASLVGFAAVCVGVIGVAFGTQSRFGYSLPSLTRDRIGSITRSEWWFIAVTLLGIALLARYLVYGQDFLVGSAGTELPTTWGNYLNDLRHAMLPAGLVAVHLLLSSKGRPLSEKAILSGILVVAAIYSVLQYSRRPLVLLVMGTFVYLVHAKKLQLGRFRSRYLLIPVAVAALFAIVLFAAGFRWLVLRLGVPLDWNLLVLAFKGQGPGALNLDAYAVHLSSVSWYSDASDWLMGGSFAQVLTNPIPRSLWPGKPESFGFTIAKLMGNYGTNYGPTIFGEGYANFGLFGSFLFGWILGSCARAVQQYQESSRSEFALVVTSMVSFEFFPQVRGDLQGMTTPLIERVALLVLAVWLVVWLSRRIRRYAHARNPAAEADDADNNGGEHAEQERSRK
jgi:oligosaccharide repeat unit polymerase